MDSPHALFLGLNPSTADQTSDDPTIRRCVNFTKSWGFGGLVMANLFAYRATNPKDMLDEKDPVGISNDDALKSLAENAGLIVCAWGAHGGHRDRDKEVFSILKGHKLTCLGLTKDGHPRHPLYMRSDSVPIEFDINRYLK